jgi:hypothetical protein
MEATRNQGRRLMLGLLDNAKYWRSRAEEARMVAESLEDAQSKLIMLGIARDYERIAELAEQPVKSGGLPAAPWPGYSRRTDLTGESGLRRAVSFAASQRKERTARFGLRLGRCRECQLMPAT